MKWHVRLRFDDQMGLPYWEEEFTVLAGSERLAVARAALQSESDHRFLVYVDVEVDR